MPKKVKKKRLAYNTPYKSARNFSNDYSGSFGMILCYFLSKSIILKVSLKINGEMDSSGIRRLNEDENNNFVLEKSSVDSFIMAVKK
jgi:hypothetical protein